MKRRNQKSHSKNSRNGSARNGQHCESRCWKALTAQSRFVEWKLTSPREAKGCSAFPVSWIGSFNRPWLKCWDRSLSRASAITVTGFNRGAHTGRGDAVK